MMNFANKVAIVTGGTRGIGKAIARTLAKNQAKVLIGYRIDEEEARKTEKELGAISEVIAIQADLRQEEEVIAMVQKGLSAFGKIDLLVNNAGGIGGGCKYLQCDLSTWNDMISSNLTSAFLCTKHVIKHMLNQNYGRIVNISSVVAQTGLPGFAAYAAAKAGLVAFSKSLAKEIAEKNINVNTIISGVVNTRNVLVFGADKMKTYVSTYIPKGRIAEPEEIAALAAYLCSDQAEYLTGGAINITGGI